MKLIELKEMCDNLGIQATPTRHRTNPDRMECSMTDYIKAIQDYYLAERKANGTYDPSIEFMLKMYSPMLALLLKNLPQDKQDELKDDNNKDWIYQEKIDGNRQIITFNASKKQFHFYSRNLSVTDMLPIDYADKIVIPPLNMDIINNMQSFVLDCEVVPAHEVTDERVYAASQLNVVSSILQYLPEESHHIQETNPLKSIAFDCLMYNDEYLFDKPLRERREYLHKIVKLLQLAGFSIELVPEKPEGMTKDEYYYSIIDAGGEGVIAKNLNDTYDILGKRDGRWVKLKRSVQETMIRQGQDSIDAFVTGFTLGTPGTKNENKIGALIFSVYLADDNNNIIYRDDGTPVIHEIAQIAGISDELRDMLTQYDDNGNVMLNPRFLNQVGTIDGQDISSREMKMMHARFLGWRLDRSFNTCIVKKSLLESMVL